MRYSHFLPMVFYGKIFRNLNSENIKGNMKTNVLTIYTLFVIALASVWLN